MEEPMTLKLFLKCIKKINIFLLTKLFLKCIKKTYASCNFKYSIILPYNFKYTIKTAGHLFLIFNFFFQKGRRERMQTVGAEERRENEECGRCRGVQNTRGFCNESTRGPISSISLQSKRGNIKATQQPK